MLLDSYMIIYHTSSTLSFHILRHFVIKGKYSFLKLKYKMISLLKIRKAL
jgi:hypothetical protein